MPTKKTMIGKLLRFLKNPRPYFYIFPYRFWGDIKVIGFYRRFIIPYIVFRVRRKKKINVIFLAMNPDMWKYDDVYQKLVRDQRFYPVIVTAMRNIPQMDVRVKEQEGMVSYFAARGYNVLRGYDVASQKWINLSSLHPDIIFHTQPYDSVIEREFEFFNHLNALHCYSPYAFLLGVAEWNWNSNLVQYCWKVFYACETQLQVCDSLSRVGKSNAIASGYCFEEEYSGCLEKVDDNNAAWKNDSRKRLIWAPHHSITENEVFRVSSFLEIADLMVQFREGYKDKVIFAFKPHPVLKVKLYQIWGKDKTDRYYKDWAEAENSFDAQGDYKALFAGSDAMIHCSGSFIVEYLYTGKPVAYVYSKTRNPPDIGPIGDAALEAHYSMHSEADIRRFIDDVVLDGRDTMYGARKNVANQYLKSPNGRMFSENVYNCILEGLGLNVQISEK